MSTLKIDIKMGIRCKSETVPAAVSSLTKGFKWPLFRPTKGEGEPEGSKSEDLPIRICFRDKSEECDST